MRVGVYFQPEAKNGWQIISTHISEETKVGLAEQAEKSGMLVPWYVMAALCVAIKEGTVFPPNWHPIHLIPTGPFTQ